jgi:hypothetical protein
MKTISVPSDERIVATENASYRWAYLTLSFGLLGVIGYRAFARGESSWDLLALLIAGGVVSTGYRLAQRTLSRQWAMVAMASAAVAGIIAAIIVAIRS